MHEVPLTTAAARLFKSPQWADQFKALADGFAQLKSDVLNALAIRTAVRIEDVSAKLDKIYALITSKTEQEKDFDRDVRNRGGLDACLNSSSKIRELAEKRGEMLKDEVTGKNKGLEAALLYDLRTPLETLLEDNRTLFEVTLKAQTSQIEDAIKNTETRLLEAFSAGPYKRIKDPVRHGLCCQHMAHPSAALAPCVENHGTSPVYAARPRQTYHATEMVTERRNTVLHRGRVRLLRGQILPGARRARGIHDSFHDVAGSPLRNRCALAGRL